MNRVNAKGAQAAGEEHSRREALQQGCRAAVGGLTMCVGVKEAVWDVKNAAAMSPEEAERKKEERKRKLREAAAESAETGTAASAFERPETSVPEDASTPVCFLASFACCLDLRMPLYDLLYRLTQEFLHILLFSSCSAFLNPLATLRMGLCVCVLQNVHSRQAEGLKQSGGA